jgi:glucuronate isomerase
VESLGRYLDLLDREGALPKTIVYNLNPADNYAIAAMTGNFQDGSIPGKIQYGSGWWYLDQKEGMEWQINALSNVGLLSRFVGMLTDSRSFMAKDDRDGNGFTPFILIVENRDICVKAEVSGANFISFAVGR